MFDGGPLAVEAPGSRGDDLKVNGTEGMEGSGARMPLNCLAAGVTDE